MGKKSRKGKDGDGGGGAVVEAAAAQKSRCVECKSFVKTAERGHVCPGCERLYCDPCATHGSRKAIGFLCCANAGDGCNSPPRCSDCAFGVTIGDIGKENKARRDRGEPVAIKEKEHKADYPMSICGNSKCSEMLCFNCFTFSTKGKMGHHTCLKCYTTRCFACSVECGDPSLFMMPCMECFETTCSECDPAFQMPCMECYEFKCSKCDTEGTMDMSTCEYYCGKCSAEKRNAHGNQLVKATNAFDPRAFRAALAEEGLGSDEEDEEEDEKEDVGGKKMMKEID